MFLIKGHPFPPFSSGLSFIERERGPGRRPKAKQSEPKRRHNRRSGQTSPLILFPSASEQEKATGASSYPMNPTPGTSEGSSRTSAAHGRAQSAGADRWPGDLLSFREMGRTWAERLVDDFFFFFFLFALFFVFVRVVVPHGRPAELQHRTPATRFVAWKKTLPLQSIHST